MDKYTFSTGENIDYLKGLPSGSIDLVYLDPPFNTGKEFCSYDERFSEESAFDDLWKRTPNSLAEYEALKVDVGSYQLSTNYYADVLELLEGTEKLRMRRDRSTFSYLVNMSRRLLQVHRVLRDTGSVVYHCDTHACGYINDVLDTLFGRDKQINHIIWSRSDTNKSTRGAGPIHDHLLIYGKTDDYIWNDEEAYHPSTLKYEESFTLLDADGRKYKIGDLTGPGRRGGTCGLSWGEYDPNTFFPKPRHWAIPMRSLRHEYKIRSGGLELDSDTSQEKLDKLLSVGLVVKTKEGFVGYVQYFNADGGMPLVDLWLDAHRLTGNSRESIGFKLDTQKPEALLRRLISILSPKDGVVLDPFAGSGTTGRAAFDLGRSFICYEINPVVAESAKDKLTARCGIMWGNQDFSPVNAEALRFQINLATEVEKTGPKGKAQALEIRHTIQVWVMVKLKGHSNGKGTDGGIDGWFNFTDFRSAERKECIAQVKTRNCTSDDIVILHNSLSKRPKAICGIMIVPNLPSKEILATAASFGFHRSSAEDDTKEYPIIQIMTFDDVFEKDPLFGRIPGFVQRLDPDKSPDAIQRRALDHIREVKEVKQTNRETQTELFDEMLELESE